MGEFFPQWCFAFSRSVGFPTGCDTLHHLLPKHTLEFAGVWGLLWKRSGWPTAFYFKSCREYSLVVFIGWYEGSAVYRNHWLYMKIEDMQAPPKWSQVSALGFQNEILPKILFIKRGFYHADEYSAFIFYCDISQIKP